MSKRDDAAQMSRTSSHIEPHRVPSSHIAPLRLPSTSTECSTSGRLRSRARHPPFAYYTPLAPHRRPKRETVRLGVLLYMHEWRYIVAFKSDADHATRSKRGGARLATHTTITHEFASSRDTLKPSDSYTRLHSTSYDLFRTRTHSQLKANSRRTRAELDK